MKSTTRNPKLKAYRKRMDAYRNKAKAMGLDVRTRTWEAAYFQLTGRRLGAESVATIIDAQRAGWQPYCVNGITSEKIAWRPPAP